MIPLTPLFHKAPKISYQCFVEFQYAKYLQNDDINIDEAIIELYLGLRFCVCVCVLLFLILVVIGIKSNCIAGNLRKCCDVCIYKMLC